jgi:hypothetical protein
MKEIKYVGFYYPPYSNTKRAGALSAINKMDYIVTALHDAGFAVHLVSPSWMGTDSENYSFEFGNTKELFHWKKLTLPFSWRTSHKISTYFKIIYSLVWLFFWLLRHTKKNEKILVYHSPWLALPILLAKKIKSFHIILEVEEIYGSVWDIRSILKKWEHKIISESDSYFVVSELLSEKLKKKNTTVIYGSYYLPFINNQKRNFSTINIVFAGAIDKIKGGAFNIVNCIDYLPDNYVVNILGYGDSFEIQELINLIQIKNNAKGRLSCIYHGVKHGNEYNEFLYKCHIGVNSQKSGDYMLTAFPSKILSYMSHNLAVVTTPIKSIENSSLKEYIVFSRDEKPESIAESIISIDIHKKINFSEIIEKYHTDFVLELKKTFE